MDNANFPFMSAAEMSIGGIDNVLVLRVSFTGETGYEMYLPMTQQLALFDLLQREGANLDLKLVGTRCLDANSTGEKLPGLGTRIIARLHCRRGRHGSFRKTR